ncbi:hypothetical protein KGF56_001787 [Candida oxycetoniae]|uniref:Uncharacterized protein n=1 Tax=Candida oxycetoniae TaxID=497107 RepID=A0AAI9SYC1_9ASCO|nr:uncharacterized protein KGF56_001787 [Candida oxycetoniae]KAI3405391.2 hypothetical protein KGF56_001787 [Candida oxycetoniae]
MSSSEGTFFSKLKNTLKGEKDTDSSPNPEKYQDEARKEGEKLFHEQHGDTTGSGGTISSGKTSSPTSHAKTADTKHENILKEAWEEGEKLFHHHATAGKDKTSFEKGKVGAAGTTDSYAASSSKGRVVSTPPKPSREPLAHEIPGDYSNSKNPTDPTVVANESKGSSGSDNHLQTTPNIVENTNPKYSDQSKQAQGHGKFFDPRDTQGGLLQGATSSTGAANAYNQQGDSQLSHQEATKAHYVDTEHLKTKPSEYEQRDRENNQVESIKEEAYREGNKHGTKASDDDNAHSRSKQVGGSGTTTEKNKYDNDDEARAVHQENKSAYNPDGVQGAFENEYGRRPANETKKEKSDPTTISSGNAVYGGSGVATAQVDGYDPVANDRKIAELDREINKTDNKIRELKQDPSNASVFAVRDETVQTPKLSNVHEDFENTQADKNSQGNANQSQGVLAGATGALAAAAGYLGLNKSSDVQQQQQQQQQQGTSNIESIKKEAHDAGFKQGEDLYRGLGKDSRDGLNAQVGGAKSDAYNEGVRSGAYEEGAKSGAYEEGAKSGAYEEGVKSGAYDQGIKSGKSDAKQTAHEEDQRPGIIEGAKQAMGGVATTAAGYLGINSSSNKDNATEANTAYSSSQHKDILDASYAAGRQKYEDERRSGTAKHGVSSSTGKSIISHNIINDERKVSEWNKQHGFIEPIEGQPVTEEEQDVKDSMLKDAEKVDPSIDRYPAHKISKADTKPEVTEVKQEAIPSYKGSEGEIKASEWNKQHGFIEPIEGQPVTEEEQDVKDSMLKDAEKVDPSIDRYPAHKISKADTKPEVTEVKQEAIPSYKGSEGEIKASEWNKQHGFIEPIEGQPVTEEEQDVKDSMLKDAEKVDPSIDKYPAHKISKADIKEEKSLPPGATPEEVETAESREFKELEKETARYNKEHGFVGDNGKKSLIEVAEEVDPSIESLPTHKKQAVDENLSNQSEPSGGDVQPLPAQTPTVSHNEIKQNLGLASHDAGGHGGSARHRTPPAKKLNDEENASNNDGKSNDRLTGNKDLHAHKKNVSGASFNITQPIGASELNSNEGPVLDSSLRKEIYDHGFKKGTADQSTASNQFSGAVSELHPTLRKELYDSGYAQGKGDAEYVTAAAAAVPSRGLTQSDSDTKQDFKNLKRDLYEHGYAKASGEKRAEDFVNNVQRDTQNSGTSASVGSVSGYDLRDKNEYGQPGERVPIDKRSELVGEETAHRRGEDSTNNLVVEVVGISDKDKALRAARDASRKLEERGVDMTSGKLVIDANSRKIYKEEYSARGDGSDQTADVSELARQRLHEAARQNAGISAETGGATPVTATDGAGTVSATSKPIESSRDRNIDGDDDDDEIFVNVKGIKDNTLATKIAKTAVARLQKTHGAIVSEVKELLVDASSGIVKDENGNVIACYEDLAVGGTKSSKPFSQSLSSDKAYDEHSSTVNSTSNRLPAKGAGAGVGVEGNNLAVAAAQNASTKYPHLTEPTHQTSANTGKYDYAFKSEVQPPFPSGSKGASKGTSMPDHGHSYSENKIHSSGYSNDNSIAGAAGAAATGHDSYSKSTATSSFDGSASEPSSGLPTHSNFDNKEFSDSAYSNNRSRQSQGGSLLGESSSAASSGVPDYEDGNVIASTSEHLSSREYPKSAVEEYLYSSNSNVDKKAINDDASRTANVTNSTSKNLHSATASDYIKGGILDETTTATGTTNTQPSTSATNTNTTTVVGEGTTGGGATGLFSSAHDGVSANATTKHSDYEEANTSSGSYHMPGSWS